MNLEAIYLLVASAGSFWLGWLLCHQSQKDARDAMSRHLADHRATTQTIIDATREESHMADRLKETAAAFDRFRDRIESLDAAVRASREEQLTTNVALAKLGAITRDRAAGRPASPPPLDRPATSLRTIGGGGGADPRETMVS